MKSYDKPMNAKRMRGSRNFRRGGGGPGQSDKKSFDNVFFSPPLILRKSNGQFKYIIFQGSRGVQHFPGGSNFFLGGGGGGGGGGPIAYFL